MTPKSKVNITELMNQRSLVVQFQTVVSHHQQFPRGVEAFVKGVNPIDGSFIHPLDLFKYAEEAHKVEELNLLMAEAAFLAFRRILDVSSNVMVFINVHGSMMKHAKETVNGLLKSVNEAGVDPRMVILELSDFPDTPFEHVLSFISHAREADFYISIDDIGRGYFNMDRILLFNPDMIKINMQHLARLSHEDYKIGMKHQITYLAHELGIIVGVTGIETEEEMTEAFDDGAQFFQGYYLDLPKVIQEQEMDYYLASNKIDEKLKPYVREVHIEETRQVMNKLVLVLNDIREASKQVPVDDHVSGIQLLFTKYPFLQNAWVVDEKGIQVTKARINNKRFNERNASIFKIFDVGHDHSDEEFFRIMNSGALDVWITKPFISLLNNQLCFSTASYLEPTNSERYILCCEVNYDQFKKIHMDAGIEHVGVK